MLRQEHRKYFLFTFKLGTVFSRTCNTVGTHRGTLPSRSMQTAKSTHNYHFLVLCHHSKWFAACFQTCMNQVCIIKWLFLKFKTLEINIFLIFIYLGRFPYILPPTYLVIPWNFGFSGYTSPLIKFVVT
jgi:hypothetical protein